MSDDLNELERLATNTTCRNPYNSAEPADRAFVAAAANPATVLRLIAALRQSREALSVFGRAVDDGPGGTTEGVPDETPVRMFFADPEFDGEDSLLGEPFMRAFRTAAALSGSREQ